jgi:hypothetical protein
VQFTGGNSSNGMMISGARHDTTHDPRHATQHTIRQPSDGEAARAWAIQANWRTGAKAFLVGHRGLGREYHLCAVPVALAQLQSRSIIYNK